MVKWFLTREPRSVGKEQSFQNGARKTEYPYAKGCLSNIIYKNCQKNSKELNV